MTHRRRYKCSLGVIEICVNGDANFFPSLAAESFWKGEFAANVLMF